MFRRSLKEILGATIVLAVALAIALGSALFSPSQGTIGSCYSNGYAPSNDASSSGDNVPNQHNAYLNGLAEQEAASERSANQIGSPDSASPDDAYVVVEQQPKVCFV